MSKPYLGLLDYVLKFGQDRDDRTGTGTRSIFGYQMRFSLQNEFPIITTKKIHFKSVVHELLWFLSGETHVKPLQDASVRIWDAWATQEQTDRFGRPEGELGPVYGHQWRNFGATQRPGGGFENDGVDQIKRLLAEIESNPASRRLIVTGWNPDDVYKVALPPCHTLFQFYVQNGELSCHLYQRSADVFLGLPFNIASYALLTHMVAHVTGLSAGHLVVSIGDAHLYDNHLDQAKLQLKRSPRGTPRLKLRSGVKDLFAFCAEDIALEGYDPHPHIKGDVSV